MTTKWIGEDGRPHDHTSFCTANGCTPVPATPAPSQPAGARECEYPPEVKSILDRCEANVVSFSNGDVSTLLVEIDRLAQQTAAKDAELDGAHRVWCELIRERDSLRAELAALKAGKE